MKKSSVHTVTTLREKSVKMSSRYLLHGIEEEHENPIVHEAALESINCNINNFILQWNSVMGDAWKLDIDGMNNDEAIEYCEQLLYSFPSMLELELINNLKSIYWEKFC